MSNELAPYFAAMVVSLTLLGSVLVIGVPFYFSHKRKMREFGKLKKNYQALFCEKPGCQNLKYFRFKFCANHVEGYLHEIDPNEERPSFQPHCPPGEGNKV